MLFHLMETNFCENDLLFHKNLLYILYNLFHPSIFLELPAIFDTDNQPVILFSHNNLFILE